MITNTLEKSVITRKNVNRMDIWMVELRGGSIGCEQSGVRPMLITQNFLGNKHSPTTIAFSITTSANKAKLPTHVPLSAEKTGLSQDSIVLTETVRQIDMARLLYKVGKVDIETMNLIDRANMISQGLEKYLD